MQVIIDRFEDDFAVVELPDKNTLPIHKRLVPENAKEGDVIEITINSQLTEERKKKLESKFNSLMRKKQ